MKNEKAAKVCEYLLDMPIPENIKDAIRTVMPVYLGEYVPIDDIKHARKTSFKIGMSDIKYTRDYVVSRACQMVVYQWTDSVERHFLMFQRRFQFPNKAKRVQMKHDKQVA